MALPFTADQFCGVFRACNTAVWPMQRAEMAAGAGVYIWQGVGAQAAFPPGVWPDLGPIAAGAVGLALLVPWAGPLRAWRTG